MKKRLGDLLTIVLASGAVIVVGMVIHRIWFTVPEYRNSVFIDNWKNLMIEERMTGSPDAPVQFVKFLDYQCEYCLELENVIHEVRNRYPGAIAITYRNLPVLGEISRKLAISALCAAENGNFETHHNWLYDNREHLYVELNIRDDSSAVELLSFNNKNVRLCVENEVVSSVLAEDIETARNLEIRSTPSLIINGQLVIGAVSVARLESIIKPILVNNSKSE